MFCVHSILLPAAAAQSAELEAEVFDPMAQWQAEHTRLKVPPKHWIPDVPARVFVVITSLAAAGEGSRPSSLGCPPPPGPATHIKLDSIPHANHGQLLSRQILLQGCCPVEAPTSIGTCCKQASACMLMHAVRPERIGLLFNSP